MALQLAIVAPLIGLAATLAAAARPDPLRRSRQEARWRDLIRAAGLAERP